MAKLDDLDLRGTTPELQEWKDQVMTLLNFGKYQVPVVSSVPTWVGRRGEEVYFISGATGRLYVCSSDNSATWTIVSSFTV